MLSKGERTYLLRGTNASGEPVTYGYAATLKTRIRGKVHDAVSDLRLVASRGLIDANVLLLLVKDVVDSVEMDKDTRELMREMLEEGKTGAVSVEEIISADDEVILDERPF